MLMDVINHQFSVEHALSRADYAQSRERASEREREREMERENTEKAIDRLIEWIDDSDSPNCRCVVSSKLRQLRSFV